jgi:hypothetical protein
MTRVNALLRKADTVIRLLQEMTIVYECVLALVWLVFIRLSPCRRTLLVEARRMEAEYNAAKRSYDQALELCQSVLDTWGRVESMQTQEVRSLLEQKLRLISQKACGLTDQTTKKALAHCGMSLEEMGVGHGSPGTLTGRGVSVSQYPGWARHRASGLIMQYLGDQVGNGDIIDRLQESSFAEAGVSHFTWIMCNDPHSTYPQQYSKVLIIETKARAKDFLRLSQLELNLVLETLKSEYTEIILDLAGIANAKLLKVVRGIINQAELQPLPEGWENRLGMKLSVSVSTL